MTKTPDNSYRVIRMFRDDTTHNKVIARGLTLEEAQEHCRNPETSSSTATGLVETVLTKNFGPWFDGYEEE
jgi:hypothetical protein